MFFEVFHNNKTKFISVYLLRCENVYKVENYVHQVIKM